MLRKVLENLGGQILKTKVFYLFLMRPLFFVAFPIGNHIEFKEDIYNRIESYVYTSYIFIVYFKNIFRINTLKQW